MVSDFFFRIGPLKLTSKIYIYAPKWSFSFFLVLEVQHYLEQKRIGDFINAISSNFAQLKL